MNTVLEINDLVWCPTNEVGMITSITEGGYNVRHRNGCGHYREVEKVTPKEAWLRALRSGRYKQGIMALRNRDNTYCCLGVACDQYLDMDWFEGKTSWKMGEHYTSLPKRVQDWLGLLAPSGYSKYRGNTLVTLNDIQKLSFEEIADIIEKGDYFVQETS